MRKAILHLKTADPVLGGIIEKVGKYRIEYLEPEFSTLVRSIVYQQLSGKAAATIYNRLAAAVGDGGRLSPDLILALGANEMRRVGLSQQKTAYILDLAERTLSGGLDFAALRRLTDQQVIGKLTEVKGIGIWTAHMFLIFALRRANVLPSADLGIRVAIQKAYSLPELPPVKQVAEIARSWHPYCTVASWYLWRSLEEKAGL